MREDMQSRLIRFSGICISIRKHIKTSYEGDHLSKQLIRSATGAALNYGEARSAESRKDFIHKQGIVLKELRESHVNLMIVDHIKICRHAKLIKDSIDEANQLVSIFVTSVKTSMLNNRKNITEK